MPHQSLWLSSGESPEGKKIISITLCRFQGYAGFPPLAGHFPLIPEALMNLKDSKNVGPVNEVTREILTREII